MRFFLTGVKRSPETSFPAIIPLFILGTSPFGIIPALHFSAKFATIFQKWQVPARDKASEGNM